jgi:hypothetical protein
MSIFHHKRNLLVRFNWENPSAHLFAGFANIIVFGASNFETFHKAGFHPLTNIMTSQRKTLNCSLSAAFEGAASPSLNL